MPTLRRRICASTQENTISSSFKKLPELHRMLLLPLGQGKPSFSDSYDAAGLGVCNLSRSFAYFFCHYSYSFEFGIDTPQILPLGKLPERQEEHCVGH